jgi:hypothetical protein
VVNTSSFTAHRNSCGINLAASGKESFLWTGSNTGTNEDDFSTSKQESVHFEKEQRTTGRIEKSRLGNQTQTQWKKIALNF